MKVLTKLQILDKLKEKNKTFQVLILEYKYPKNSFNGKILGLTLAEWVKNSVGFLPNKTLKIDDKINILEFIKDKIDNTFDYTIVLLSKTPLIQSDDINNIIEYVTVKSCNLCKLPVGYVVNNEYILSAAEYQIDSLYSQNIEDFYQVETKAQYNHANKVLQERINSFHQDNGVELISPDKVYIEPFVDILEGVVIYPNNSLKGKTQIGVNVILKENNVIDNSKIGDNSCISGSIIKDSVISSSVYISAFCEINNSLIGKDSIIEKGVSINNYNLNIGSKIKANSIWGETNDSDSGTR